MSTPGRPKGEYRSAQREGTPVSAAPGAAGAVLLQGRSLVLRTLDEGFVELCFDREGEAINKLDALTMTEFRRALELVAADPKPRGMLVSSAKEVFIVGADITEFGAKFQATPEAIAADVLGQNQIFVAFEDLPLPSVVAINGFALGGGLELALAGAVRVAAASAQVGVPEVKLGLFPGFGGTVRLSRVAGLALAAGWVVGGRPANAEAALAAGVVDAVASPAALRDTALDWLRRCADGRVDWRARQQRKCGPAPDCETGAGSAFALQQRAAEQAAARHQPAAAMALQMMVEAAGVERAAALMLEAAAFGRVARTQAAKSMIRTFLNEQAVRKLARRHAKAAAPVQRAAVVGAGIMGGGIAYASAAHGIPVRLKDIAQSALDGGLREAARLAARQVQAGRMDEARAQALQSAITAQQDDAGFDAVDLVVEAVVEQLALKHRVLAGLEASTREDTVIASNTSSLRIDELAAPLARPQNFVGMHFFNPVPAMPLVEVIRGSRTAEAAVSRAVGYAAAMGKTPVVVRDCPGFLVNRILTAYVIGFLELVAEGQDFEAIDRAMEGFGWPMGPAWLEDVVGMDTARHVMALIVAGYPQRMRLPAQDAVALMAAHGRLGQKSGAGFYAHARDAAGRMQKSSSPEAHALLAALRPAAAEALAPAQIVERMMLPLIVESVWALQEGVVATAAELDMALLLGIGFPAWLGGALQYADWLGLPQVAARCEALGLGVPDLLREMAATGRSFHG
jgi:3-hydroxyacyl-CoA dehydrogenase/enoyl-CoA hydratase/3-hydroxybutyryl-CoA epimerase/enoyl-CoA isomerase